MSSRARFAALPVKALLVLAALGLAGCGGDGDDDSTPSASPTPAGVTGNLSPQSPIGNKINETAVPEAMAEGKRIGPADAKVVIEAYEDFGCPHCLEFTAEIEPVIFAEFVATGKVSFEYKYFALRQQTAVAAIAAQCANEQGKFWPYHRALFITQAEANAKTGPALAEAFALANLKTLAGDLGLDAALFDTCLSGDSAIDVVQAELKQANDLVLPGTPAFVINGKVTPGPETADGWRKLLNDLLK